MATEAELQQTVTFLTNALAVLIGRAGGSVDIWQRDVYDSEWQIETWVKDDLYRTVTIKAQRKEGR